MSIFNVTGGGGTSLNFKVVGGTTAPASPKENTIWVNTDVEIPSWIFAAEEPSPAEAGMVWISTGTASNVAFNALKKNDVQVYPLNAKQYVGGAWVAKEAQTYQGGEWAEWVKYLYAYGDQCTDIGGEWTSTGVGIDSSNSNKNPPTIIFGSGSMVISQVLNKGGVAHKAEKIDLTNISTLTLNVTKESVMTNTRYRRFQVWTDFGAYFSTNSAAQVEFSSADGDETVTLNVSALQGEYYVGISIFSEQTITVNYLRID